MPWVLLNNELLENFPLNRAFEYGDGIFETIIVRKNQIFFWPKHYQRLCQAMQALLLEKPAFFTADFLEKAIWQVAEKNGFMDTFRVKINVWRQGAGWYIPETNAISWLIRTFPYSPKPFVKYRAIFFDKVPLIASPISPYKTCNALPYIMAGLEKKAQHADEVILLDYKAHLADTLTANIFWIVDGCIHTPSLNCGGKKGIVRGEILELCQKKGIPFREGLFNKNDILRAEAVFTSNVAGIEAIAQIENTHYNTSHTWIEEFRKLLEA